MKNSKTTAKSSKKSEIKKNSSTSQTPSQDNIEIISLKASEVVQKVKDLIREGNVRKITVISKKGETLLSIPLSVGVIGVALAPMFAILASVVAFVTECQLKIERNTT